MLKTIIVLLFPLFSWAKPFYDNAGSFVHDLSVSPGLSSGWLKIKDDIPLRVAEIDIYQESGVPILFAFTTDGSTPGPASDSMFTIYPVGIDRQWKTLPLGSDLFIRAESTDALAGKIYFNFWLAPVISSQ